MSKSLDNLSAISKLKSPLTPNKSVLCSAQAVSESLLFFLSVFIVTLNFSLTLKNVRKEKDQKEELQS